MANHAWSLLLVLPLLRTANKLPVKAKRWIDSLLQRACHAPTACGNTRFALKNVFSNEAIKRSARSSGGRHDRTASCHVTADTRDRGRFHAARVGQQAHSFERPESRFG
eukprot:5892399-Pleurochrysis_carterae.AAC.1